MRLDKLLEIEFDNLTSAGLQTRMVYVVDPPVFTYDNNDNEKIITPANAWASAAAEKIKGKILETGGYVEDAQIHPNLGLCLLVNNRIDQITDYNNLIKYSLCASIEYFPLQNKHIYYCDSARCEDVMFRGIDSGCNSATHSYYVDFPNLHNIMRNKKLKGLKRYNSYYSDIQRYNNFKNIKHFDHQDLLTLFPNIKQQNQKEFSKINKIIKENLILH